MPTRPIYLDHAASTAPDPAVIEAMLPWLREFHANPHSHHLHGQRASEAVEHARERVANLIGGRPEEIVFTSGATESNNLAILGYLSRARDGALLTTSIEHKSIRAVAAVLRERGVRVSGVPVDRFGTAALSSIDGLFEQFADCDRRLLAIAHANNEIGTVQPIEAIGDLMRASDWRLHVDAAQSAGKIPIDVESSAAQSLSLSSHKLYGPAGIGALYVAMEARDELSPIMFGGGQEGGLRPGSIPTFLAVGFGVAAELAAQAMHEDRSRLESITRTFLAALSERGLALEVLGHPTLRIPGHLCLKLDGADAADLLQRVAAHLSASLGSACTAGQIGASHVLRGIGLDDGAAAQVIRIGFGRKSTIEDAQAAAAILNDALVRQAAV